MNKDYQEMTFSLNRYSWHKSDEEARADMWKDIATFLQILTRNDCIAVVYDDDTDMIVVQYEHDENKDDYGCTNPKWITEDEWYDLECDRAEKACPNDANY